MLESFKTTRAYKIYRQSLVYDRVRKNGKVLKRAIKLPHYLGSDYQCPVCGQTLFNDEPLQKHHFLPRQDGGPNTYQNYRLLHLYCHQQITIHHRQDTKSRSS